MMDSNGSLAEVITLNFVVAMFSAKNATHDLNCIFVADSFSSVIDGDLMLTELGPSGTKPTTRMLFSGKFLVEY